MNILVTGDYDPSYNRTKILLSGLKAIGQFVDEYPFKKLSNNSRELLKDKAAAADIIYLPPFTHQSVKQIKKVTSKPIVFDPLISKYMTKVFDYKLVSPFSIRALKNFYKDKVPLNLSDLVIADTNEHKEYFIRKFKVAPEKIHVLPIGVLRNDFNPLPASDNKIFKIGFYGGFIPLQGVSKIIEAADHLKHHSDIEFHLIGSGFEYEKIQKQVRMLELENVYFPGFLDYADLPGALAPFNLCLGIFGDTMKADMVIPNKIYHYAAMGKCILTKGTSAIKEIFRDNKDIVLSNANAVDMAEKILYIKNNDVFRKRIGTNAHNLISGNYNEEEIAKRFVEIIKTSI